MSVSGSDLHNMINSYLNSLVLVLADFILVSNINNCAIAVVTAHVPGLFRMYFSIVVYVFFPYFVCRLCTVYIYIYILQPWFDTSCVHVIVYSERICSIFRDFSQVVCAGMVYIYILWQY